MTIAFLPQPKTVQISKGFFRIPAKGVIGICCHNLHDLAEEMQVVFPGYAIAASAGAAPEEVTLLTNPRLRAEEYRLVVNSRGVLLEAQSPSAAYYGWQTLLQAARQCPAGMLPIMRIEDRPDFAVRGLYYDMARRRVPTTESLLQQAELLSMYKINQLQYYIEHAFQFRGHPDIGRGASPLSPDDILTLDEFCRWRHIELVPSLSSFGHLGTVLQHPRYRHLAEDWGIGKYVSPEARPNPHLRGWTLSPANPKIYEFLDSLFKEFLPLFSSNQFNVCCDETWDLGWGQSYDLCRKIGKGRVYLNHILKLHDLCQKYGKRMMFWGDIIRHYPELIDEIPKDVTVLDWGYDFNHPFDRIRDFRKAGVPFYACPGTSSWVSLFPRLHEAEENIAGFAAAAQKHGAAGLLNTDWGDGGHYNFMEYSWHGYLFGAEQAWNTGADRADFTERFCKLFLNVGDPALAKAVDELGAISHLKYYGYYQSIWQHLFFAPSGDKVLREEWNAPFTYHDGKIGREVLPLDARLGRDAMKRLVPVKRHLQAAARMKDADPAGVLPYWVFATDTISHAARKLALLGKGGADTAAGRKSLAREAAALQKRFVKLWMARNRRSEIAVTLKRYRAAIAGLRRPPAPRRAEKPVEYKYLLRLPKGYEAGAVPGAVSGAMPLRVLAEGHVRAAGPKDKAHGRDARDTHGQDAHATKLWPLMLFLHGAGERGDDLNLVKVHGPPKVADKLAPKDFPFILLAPQCPADKRWHVKPLLALLDTIMRQYPIDPARVYLTGMSMGGYGTWALAAAAPGRFAAIAPICGGGDPANAAKLSKLPIWTFHGGKDTVVPINSTQAMVDAIQRVGGRRGKHAGAEVKFTIYPNANHDSWTATYNNPALYRWLLTKKKVRG